MTHFNEANTVEAYILDILCGGITKYTALGHGLVCVSEKLLDLGWRPNSLIGQPYEVQK